MRSSRADVSAELRLALVARRHDRAADAGLSYRAPIRTRADGVLRGTDEPVEWTLSRDLLAAALHAARVSGCPGCLIGIL